MDRARRRFIQTGVYKRQRVGNGAAREQGVQWSVSPLRDMYGFWSELRAWQEKLFEYILGMSGLPKDLAT